jgi:hypothetical protein
MRFVDVNLKCGWPECTVFGAEGGDDVFTRTITLDGKKPREIDICKQHAVELDEVLAPLLADGRAIEEKTKPSGRRPRGNSSETASKSASSPSSSSSSSEDHLVCRVPECNRDGEPLKSNVGLAQHAIRTHGFESLDAYFEQYPPPPSD